MNGIRHSELVIRGLVSFQFCALQFSLFSCKEKFSLAMLALYPCFKINLPSHTPFGQPIGEHPPLENCHVGLFPFSLRRLRKVEIMFALQQPSTGAILAYLCVVAGLLIIVASVVFVIKGKAVLDSGTQKFKWGPVDATLTSAIALFVLGAAMIALPFWRVVQIEAAQAQVQAKVAEEVAAQPPMAILKGTITGADDRDIRLLLVEKPDYDQNYRGAIEWRFPFFADRPTYSVFYIDGGKIVGQQSFSVQPVKSGSSPQEIALGTVNLQTGKSVASEVTPQLGVSDAELKTYGLR